VKIKKNIKIHYCNKCLKIIDDDGWCTNCEAYSPIRKEILYSNKLAYKNNYYD
jgi:hypothetical protein